LQEYYDINSQAKLDFMSVFPSPNQDSPTPLSPIHSNKRIGSRPGVVGRINVRILRYTLVLGAIAGLVFSMTLWAYEAILLIQAHVAYPWIPVLVGTILCVLVCTLAALLTYLVNKALIGIVFWVLAARLMAELAIDLPLKITPALMMFFEPGLRSRLPDYPMNGTFQTWAGFCTVWLGIFLGILGLLQLTLVESSVPATTAAGRLGAYFIFIPVLTLASVLSSNMINEQLRAPLIGTNKVIQFAITHQNEKVDPVIAREMHLAIVDTIPGLINRPRRLFLGNYDEYFQQVEVLIDFNGKWARCTTVVTQPVFCEPISNP
jgi:hypothetical protein